MMDDAGEVESARGGTAAVSNFSAGQVVRLAFSVFGKNPLLYLALAFFAEAPKIAMDIFMVEGVVRRLDSLVSLLISVIFSGAIAYGVYKGLIGERVGVGEAVSRGLSRYFSLLGLSFAMGILFVFIFVVSSFLSWVGMIIGAVLVFYLLCAFSVATPACVVERLGPLQSLNRSCALTKGHRLSAFGLFIVSGGCGFILGFAVGFVLAVNATVGGALEYATTILLTALMQVGVAVLYYQLRASKEGVGVSELARVFE